MKRVDHPAQASQPQTNSERELADFDVQYVLAYLSRRDKTHYVLERRPDEEERSTRASDYLYRSPDSGMTLAIEHVKLMDQDRRVATVRSVRAGRILFGLPPEAERLRAAINALGRKLRKRQLPAMNADRKVLLARNRTGPLSQDVLQSLSFPGDVAETFGVDEAYLIAGGGLWRMW